MDATVEMRDYAKKGLSAEEIGEIVDAVGSVSAVLNTRHVTAKAKGWAEKPPDKAVFIMAATVENNLLRRPVVLSGGAAVVGASEKELRRLLGRPT
jgi:arsenate reductase-like glutaredoxin family protein